MSGPGGVRVRFAPSPTGYLHVGGARSLFFNWLYARKHAGKIILRIEDTDQARSTRESERMILEDVRALGLACDEGIGAAVEGPYAPYRQSERLAIYGKHARELLESGRAYYCFCSDELITQKREAALKLGRIPHYDGTCARLDPKDAADKVARGEKAGLRYRAPHRTFVCEDHVRGRVEFKEGTVGDFFITRTPTSAEHEIAAGIGMPVYNFCCVIDDHLMGITHVIRGEEHLSNTARQLILYDAFGWKPPEFAHTAMVLGADRLKLSKRSGDVSVHEYIEQGYLPEALLNFLSLLGWWPPKDFKPASGHPEVLTIEEITSVFSLEALHKAPAVFDVQKLKWMNAFYLRAMPAAEVARRARPFFEKSGTSLVGHDAQWFEKVIDCVRGEAQLLSEIPAKAALFFEKEAVLEPQSAEALRAPGGKEIAAAFEAELRSGSGPLSADEIAAIEKKVAAATGAKGKGLYMPIRSATTGRTHGPELKKALPLIGREGVLARIAAARKQAGV